MASVNDKITDTRNSDRPNSARVSSTRSVGGTTLACNDLTGWPTASKVHGVTYQIDSNSNPVDGTQIDFYGIVSGNNITSFTVVDGTDNGNSVNDVVEMLPTAGWGQDLADGLMVSHNRDGSLKDGAVDSADVLASDVVTTAKILNSSVTTAKINDSAVTTDKINANAVTKSKLELPHYNSLFWSVNTGNVFGAAQIVTAYDAYDTVNANGITATTGANAKLTIARDGLYQISVNYYCIDVATSSFITWIYITTANGTYALRQKAEVIQVAEGGNFSTTMYLKATNTVQQQWYSGSGNTRFGYSTASSPLAPTEARRLACSLTVTEIR